MALFSEPIKDALVFGGVVEELVLETLRSRYAFAERGLTG